jgi:hypothetical protein
MMTFKQHYGHFRPMTLFSHVHTHDVNQSIPTRRYVLNFPQVQNWMSSRGLMVSSGGSSYDIRTLTTKTQLVSELLVKWNHVTTPFSVR